MKKTGGEIAREIIAGKRIEPELKKKVKKKQKKKNKGSSLLQDTPCYTATRYYIKSWGYYNKNKNIIIEKISNNTFLYNKKGKTGLKYLEPIEEVEGKKVKVVGQGFEIDGDLYIVPKKTSDTEIIYYNTPSIDLVKKFVKGKIKPRPYLELQKDLRKMLEIMFEFGDPLDVEISLMVIAQSWLKPLRDEFFFLGIDATKGGGKTTLGEIVYFLQRHGFVAGDVSSASIPRLVDEWDLNIFIDELDQNSRDENIQGILRKGQRRGNPYIRCEGTNNVPKAYSVCGSHGFSYRSELEDAFLDRAFKIPTAKTKDHRLAIINTQKNNILKPLADELFLWFIQNIHVVSCSNVLGCIGKYKPEPFFELNTLTRENLYNSIVKKFSEEEREYLKCLFGRDSELAYLCLETSKILGYPFLENLRNIMQHKQEEGKLSESIHLDSLREYIADNLPEIFTKRLKEGMNQGCYYFPKNKLFQMYVSHLKENGLGFINSKKYNSFLRDLGFVQHKTICSQRYARTPTPCLIFDEEIRRNHQWNLKYEKEKQKDDKLVEEFS